MALTQGCLNIQFLIQSVLNPPILLMDTFPNIKMHQNIKYSNSRVIQAIKIPSNLVLIWESFKFGITFAHIFSIFRIVWLFTRWQEYNDFEQVSYYVLALAITLIGRSAYAIIDRYTLDFCYIVTQRFKLIPHFYHSKLKQNKIFARY